MKRTGVIAKKIGMTSWYTDSGQRLPVTLLKIDQCQVVAQRTIERDGYSAVVLGSEKAKASRISKSMRTVFANNKVEPKVRLKEFRIDAESMLDIGTEIKADHFTIGQSVDVTGVSIGKGFAGGMKRHNFRGLEATHGVSISHRSHGSTGSNQDPGRVFKNKKMAGHMGVVKVTQQNLEILSFDLEYGVIIVKGSVPGSKGAFVYVADAIKKH